MLTSVATEPSAGSGRVVLDSVVWVVAAGLCTLTAHAVTAAEAAADHATNASFSRAENEQRRARAFDEYRARIRWCATGTVTAMLVAAALVPNLFFRASPAPASPCAPAVSRSPERGK